MSSDGGDAPLDGNIEVAGIVCGIRVYLEQAFFFYYYYIIISNVVSELGAAGRIAVVGGVGSMCASYVQYTDGLLLSHICDTCFSRGACLCRPGDGDGVRKTDGTTRMMPAFVRADLSAPKRHALCSLPWPRQTNPSPNI